MKKALAILVSGTVASMVAVSGFAQEPPPIAFETVGVKGTIDPGPNVFLLDQSWSGASTLQVFAADDFDYKGGISTGAMAQAQVSADGTTAYTISTYLERFTDGDAEMVLQVFDVATLTRLAEIALPPKIAMVGPYENLLQLADGERFALIMNATPAASVTVVDLEAGAVAMEVPTPGCWNIYPAAAGLKWTMLCGDGTAQTFVLNEDGTEIVAQNAGPIFDAGSDPLFSHAERGTGDELLFVSFGGEVYRVSDAGDAPQLTGTFSFGDILNEPFAPGGYAISAYNEANDVLFVTVHDEPYDGSHKNGSTEIWVIDLAGETLLYRLQIEHGYVSLAVTDEQIPTLYAFNEHDYTVRAFAVDLSAPYGVILTEKAAVQSSGQVITVRP